jgi:IclR family acetate operon transcriptional repressor
MRNSEPLPPLDSVHRALQLVLALREGGDLAVKDVSELLDVVPSTAYRLLAALCYDGFAIQGRDRRYRAGPELAGRYEGSFSPAQLRTLMRPAIEELNRTLNETIQVWVLKGARVSYIDGLESTQPLSVRTGVWDLVPAYCSAGGKVLLAELGNNELESIHADGLIRLVTVRQDGYAVSLEEAAQGIAGIAACVKDALGHPVAAISVAIPRSRLNRKQIPAYAKALQAAVDIVEMKITKPGEMFSDAT